VDRSLTIHPVPEVLAAPVGQDRVDLGLVVLVAPVDLTDLAGLRLVGLVVPAVPVVLGPGARVDPVDLMALAALDRMGRAALAVPVRVDPVRRVVLDITGRAVLVVLAALDRTGPAPPDRMDPVVPVVLVVLGRMDPVDPVGRVVLDITGRAVLGTTAPVVLDRMDLAAPVDLADPLDLAALAAPVVLNTVARAGLGRTDHRRRTCNAVTTTVVVRSGVVRATHRTASARPITAHRPRRGKMDSGGTVGLHREHPHPTGTAHRLLAAGTDRRPPVAGIPSGTGRHAT
jgi:hypothetical protein